MSVMPFKLHTSPIDESLDQKQAKQLCMSLIKAESEKEIINVLKNYNYWDNSECWENFGDNENNWSQIGNQSNCADYALVEKIINSIDHVLIGECKIKNIPVEGDHNQTPQSIKLAVEKFFNIKKGLLTNLDPRTRSELSEKIKLISVGSKNNPCYIIADQGEGQSPKNLPNTLLSLNKSNKIKIPFVQGKFNMGGTGVLRFCGKYNFQFILSKKNPSIKNADNDSTFNQWGFTIIRRYPPKGNFRSSIVKYLKPNGQILSFNSDQLPILPGKYPETYTTNMKYGTFVKLYNYDLKGLKSLINLNLYNRLSLLIPDIALPIRLYERRKGYESNSYESTLSGLNVRLEEDQNENLEFAFPIDLPPVNEQKITGKIYAFKKGKIESYSKTEGIIFSVNGQSHGHLNKSFFEKDKVKLSYISDSLLIILDCSDISNEAKEQLFMSSRDRLNKDASLKSAIEKELEIFLKNHKGLRELNNKRKEQAIAKTMQSNDEKLKEVIQKIITKSPVLAKILQPGQRIPSPFPKKALIQKTPLLKDFPDYFDLYRNFSQENPKNVPINNQCVSIEYETNAEDDYFSRTKDPGSFELIVNGQPYKDFSMNLWKGQSKLKINLSSNWSVGTILQFESIVKDIRGNFPFKSTFFVRISPETQSSSHKQRKNTPQKISGLNIPKPRPITKKDWEEYGFKTDKNIIKIKGDSENGYDFYINVDNIYLLTEIKERKDISDAKLLQTQYMQGLVLLGLAFLVKNKSENKEIYSFKDIETSLEVLSPFLIPIILDMKV